MTRKLLGQYIVADPKICHGKPTFIGTRIMAWQVLNMVARGMDAESISEQWSGKVSRGAIAEAIDKAQEIVNETTILHMVSTLEMHDPMPRGDNARKIAEVALRRWRSFDRRTRIKRPTLEHRVEDVAKGIRDAIEQDRRLVGPLMEEYRFTARVLVEAIQEAERMYKMP